MLVDITLRIAMDLFGDLDSTRDVNESSRAS
jgi:hypothetical protein